MPTSGGSRERTGRMRRGLERNQLLACLYMPKNPLDSCSRWRVFREGRGRLPIGVPRQRSISQFFSSDLEVDVDSCGTPRDIREQAVERIEIFARVGQSTLRVQGRPPELVNWHPIMLANESP